MSVKLLPLWSSLAIGNLLYAIAASGDYHAAVERSVFQAVALVFVWWGRRRSERSA